jgi:aspartyl-tRNA(Asn)/glutamyl-tRNA(Gln) amidotransferase subunit C
MALTLTAVDRIARLARLRLDDGERQRMLDKLNGFFSLVDAMQSVDTAGIEPLAHPLAAVQDVQLCLHADVASEAATPATRAANMENAPAAEDGLFLVPKVIE